MLFCVLQMMDNLSDLAAVLQSLNADKVTDRKVKL